MWPTVRVLDTPEPSRRLYVLLFLFDLLVASDCLMLPRLTRTAHSDRPTSSRTDNDSSGTDDDADQPRREGAPNPLNLDVAAMGDEVGDKKSALCLEGRRSKEPLYVSTILPPAGPSKILWRPQLLLSAPRGRRCQSPTPSPAATLIGASPISQARPAATPPAFVFGNRFFVFSGAPTASHEGNGVQGYGALHLLDGGVLEGHFNAEGQLTGPNGCRRYADGSAYYGDLLDGEAHGTGMFVGCNGDTYSGEYCLGRYHGRGDLQKRTEQWRYSGEFQSGKCHGWGAMHRQTSFARVIEGEFRDGLPQGDVVIQYENGDSFTGQVHRGVPVGEGRLWSPETGLSYAGPFVTGERSWFPDALWLTDVAVHGCVVLSAAAEVCRAGGMNSRSWASFVRKKVIKEKTFLEGHRQDGVLQVPLNAPIQFSVSFATRQWTIVPVPGTKGKTKTVQAGCIPSTCDTGQLITCDVFSLSGCGHDCEKAIAVGRPLQLVVPRVPRSEGSLRSIDEVDPACVAAAARRSPKTNSTASRSQFPRNAVPELPSGLDDFDLVQKVEGTVRDGCARLTVYPFTMDASSDYAFRFCVAEHSLPIGARTFPGEPPPPCRRTVPAISVVIRVKLLSVA